MYTNPSDAIILLFQLNYITLYNFFSSDDSDLELQKSGPAAIDRAGLLTVYMRLSHRVFKKVFNIRRISILKLFCITGCDK